MDKQIIDIGQQNFNLPHDIVKLPSQGVFYASKKKSVKVGYLTANDENLLLNSRKTGDDDILFKLVRSKLYEPELKIEELLEGDVKSILIFLRNSSFGPEYSLTLIDPRTSKPFQHTEILDELDFKQVEFLPDENGYYTTKLPKTGSTVKLKPVSLFKLNEIEKRADSYPQGRIAPVNTWKLLEYIVELDGNSDTAHISASLNTMPIADSKYIREFINNNEPGLDLNKVAKAPSGEMVSFKISFGVDFFRPFF